jgi:site-specific recombinase XerD
MSYDYFREICKGVSMNSGIKFHPHMGRHTYATELLKKGLFVFYVARLFAHEDLSSPQIYLHASQEDTLSDVSKIKLFENDQKQNDLDGKDRLGFGPK